MNKDELIKKYIEELKGCEELGIENSHGYADYLLCELLKALGYGEVVEEFEKLKKWYA